MNLRKCVLCILILLALYLGTAGILDLFVFSLSVNPRIEFVVGEQIHTPRIAVLHLDTFFSWLEPLPFDIRGTVYDVLRLVWMYPIGKTRYWVLEQANPPQPLPKWVNKLLQEGSYPVGTRCSLSKHIRTSGYVVLPNGETQKL